MVIRQILLQILQIIGQCMFLLQVLVLFIPLTLYRLYMKLFHDKSHDYNPFSLTHQDVFKTQAQITKFQGFTISYYNFPTKDNAYVSFWRVQKEQTHKYLQSPRQVVILQHGLLDCSMSWFLHQEKSKCLPFMLAAQNYDVWVGNNRGTKYSNQNSHISGYWSYNFDTLVDYDVPSLVNGVLNQTKVDKLIYIGHSQGTAQLLTALGVHPDLKHKIKAFIGLGAVIGISHVNDHPILKYISMLKICQILKIIGFKALFFIPSWISRMVGMLVYNIQFFKWLFHKVILELCGKTSKNNFDLNRLGVIITHQPGGASIDNVMQWVQFYENKATRRFDYGCQKNIEKYGSVEPPCYTYDHLKQLPFHCHLFKGEKDRVVSSGDFEVLVGKLNEQERSIYSLQDYGHLDYVWGINANNDIYDKIIQILGKYQISETDQTEYSLEANFPQQI